MPIISMVKKGRERKRLRKVPISMEVAVDVNRVGRFVDISKPDLPSPNTCAKVLQPNGYVLYE